MNEEGSRRESTTRPPRRSFRPTDLCFVFVDETGVGKAGLNVKCLCSTCLVSVPWTEVSTVNEGVDELRQAFLKPGRHEFAAHRLAHDLRDRDSLDSLAQRLCEVIDGTSTKIWVGVSRSGIEPPRNLRSFRNRPSELARQLAWERMTGYLRISHHDPKSWLTIWDLPESQELAAFARALSSFQNPFVPGPLHRTLEPRILGGRSEHWGPLQIADLFANFATHHAGSHLNLVGVERRRVDAFEKHFEKRLMRDAVGNVVGLAWWVGLLPPPEWE